MSFRSEESRADAADRTRGFRPVSFFLLGLELGAEPAQEGGQPRFGAGGLVAMDEPARGGTVEQPRRIAKELRGPLGISRRADLL